MASGSPPDHPFDRSTIARPRADPASAAAATFILVAIEGPDQGMQFTLDGTQPARVLIGHGPACDVRVTDREVSRRHIALELRERRLHLRDLGSMNGTYVDGVAVLEGYVLPGAIVRMGSTAFRVDLAEAATAISVTPATQFGRVIGASGAMRRLYPLCSRLAAATVSVVLEGETGTGKELMAESLHEQGPRATKPFVVFDCTAVPPTLVESDLFGHERGAFTGAVSTRKGVFEQAHGGTLLIDEIGDLDLSLQPKLLRAIERSEIRRVGGDRSISVDVRVLCATRRDLDREVQSGRFRDDLFHRIAVARLELPPLRRRRGDVRLLAQIFCQQLGASASTVPEHVLLRWEDHDWPGNIRELRNAVARYLAVGEMGSSHSTAADPAADEAPSSSSSSSSSPSSSASPGDGELEKVIRMDLPYSRARQRLLAEFERRYVERILGQHDGNVMRAAEASGVARRHFQRVKARTK